MQWVGMGATPFLAHCIRVQAPQGRGQGQTGEALSLELPLWGHSWGHIALCSHLKS